VEIDVGLYRIVQEAPTNVVCHARAWHVGVRRVITPDAIRCVVEDEGRGFDPAQIPQARYRLVGLNERVRQFSSSLVLESVPDASKDC
jgi:signal transduction histidine kinase